MMLRDASSTMVRFSAWLLAISGGVAALLATLAHAQDKPTITLDQIEKAWHRRAERFESGRISWTVRKFTARGVKSTAVGDSPFGDPSRDSTAAPAEDTRHEYTCQLTFKGSKIRFERTAPKWWIAGAEFRPGKDVMAYDNEIGTSLSILTDPSGPTLMGHIRPDDMSLVGIAAAKPLLEFYWPEWRSIEDLKGYTLTTQRESVDDAMCVVLTRRTRTGVLESLWLGPGASYPVRKYTTKDGSLIRRRREVSYSENPAYGLIPTGWKLADYDRAGKLQESQVAEITNVELNLPLDDSLFRVEFPPETLVHDATDAGEHPDTKKLYLVLHDGRKRKVTEDELFRKGMTAQELAATKPGQAGLPLRRGGTFWIWTVATTLVVVVVLGTVAGRKCLTK